MVKIEEIEQTKIPVRTETPAHSKPNPFASKKKTTIVRNDTGKSNLKGLNKLEIHSDQPLDVLFRELEEIFPEDGYDRAELYKALSDTSRTDSPVVGLFAIMEKLLGYLGQIQLLADEKRKANPDLVAISLHDIQTFSRLMNLIIIHGVYPSLSPNNGIPLNKRRLKDFDKKNIRIERIVKTEDRERMLVLLHQKLYQIFSAGGDVKDLLIRGTGYSDLLVVSIELLTNQSFSSFKSGEFIKRIQLIEKLEETYELYGIYSLLLTTPSSPYFRAFVSNRLVRLPIERKDGVQCLIEFVTGLREDEDINIEKFQRVSQILLAKPKDVSTVDYFTNICDQFYEILININRPVLGSVACFVLEELFLKNKRIVSDFLFQKVWNNLLPNTQDKIDNGTLVNESTLNNTINVLISLTKKSSSDFLMFLFEPILLQLWRYLVFNHEKKRNYDVILGIFVSYITITSDSNAINNIIQNLLSSEENIQFSIGPNQLPEIVCRVSSNDSPEQIFANLDTSIEVILILLNDLSDETIENVFISVLKRWLKINSSSTERLGDENPYVVLVNLRVLESIANKFKEKLARTPFGMLEVVKSVLLSEQKQRQSSSNPTKQAHEEITHEDIDSDDEDEMEESQESLSVVLELLSAILTETSPKDLDGNNKEILKSIMPLLEDFGTPASTALKERIDAIVNQETVPTDHNEAQRRMLSRAITSLNDPLVPIRAHGLSMLRELIVSKSPIISLDFVINLHLVQLKDPEPYIYLNVIKGLEAILDIDPNEAIPLLLEVYSKTEKEDAPPSDIDEQLRIGEVLIRYVENAGQMFIGNLANAIVSRCLSLIRVDNSSSVDNRLRMSSMSLLGICCRANPTAILDRLSDVLDCSVGILKLETSKDEAIMRRTAIVLIHDLILGSEGLQNFPESYGKEILALLKYVESNDNDLLVRDQATTVLKVINEFVTHSITSQQPVPTGLSKYII